MRTSNVPHVLLAGALAGLLLTTLPACGGGHTATRCSASNCAGCCDDTGLCQDGVSLESCGKNGASCIPCAVGQSCTPADQTNTAQGGICVITTGSGGGDGTTGGGDGATGGGTTTTGGGTATTGGGTATTGGGTATTGGGTATTGGGTATTGGGTGSCATCTTSSGTCVASTTPARCGTGGAACVSCGIGSTCVNGACQACAGCVDPTTGACVTGDTNAACGNNGDFCRACDSSQSESCTNHACVASGTFSCNSSNCDGCCDNGALNPTARCKHPGDLSVQQCGTGVAGAQCAACTSGQTCNASTLACEGGSSAGDGGFFPGGTFCDPLDPSSCPGGCCDADPSSGLGVCAAVGDTCALAPLDLGIGQPIQFGCMFAASFGTECTCKQSGSTYACGL